MKCIEPYITNLIRIIITDKTLKNVNIDLLQRILMILSTSWIIWNQSVINSFTLIHLPVNEYALQSMLVIFYSLVSTPWITSNKHVRYSLSLIDLRMLILIETQHNYIMLASIWLPISKRNLNFLFWIHVYIVFVNNSRQIETI